MGWARSYWPALREARTNGTRRWFGAQFERGRAAAAARSRRAPGPAMFVSDCRREFYELIVTQVRAARRDRAGETPWGPRGGWSGLPRGLSPLSRLPRFPPPHGPGLAWGVPGSPGGG